MKYVDSYAESAWLHDAAEVVDTTDLTPARIAAEIADAVNG